MGTMLDIIRNMCHISDTKCKKKEADKAFKEAMAAKSKNIESSSKLSKELDRLAISSTNALQGFLKEL